MLLRPKKIEPGWARRWTRQSIELFARNPWLAMSNALWFICMSAIVPHYEVLCVPAAVFVVGGLFCSLRAVDRHSGDAWYSTWAFFKGAAVDLALLSRDAFIWTWFFTTCTTFLLSGVFSGHHFSKTIAFSSHSALFLWIRDIISIENSIDMIGVFLIGGIPLIYLTMLTGNKLLHHFVMGYHAAFMNPSFTDMVTVPGAIFCICMHYAILSIDSWYTLGVLVVLYSAVFWWFGTWGYLWCREMFEGDCENGRVTRPLSVHDVLPAI